MLASGKMRLMDAKIKSVILAYFLGGMTIPAQHTSLFDPQLLKTVVSIEQLDSPSNAHAIGTGFLLQTTNSHIALVTAKHVVVNEDGSVKANLAIRLNQTNKPSDLITDSYFSTLVGGWVVSSNADLACRLITWANEQDIKAMPVEKLLPQNQLEAGAPVFVLGFPMGLRAERYTVPIVRHGIVAQSAPGENLLLDAFVFPGNSGGPVIYCPIIKLGAGLTSPILGDERIVGVVVESVEYTDVAISPQTHRPRITFEENSGLSRAVPSDMILELFSRADFRKLDEKH